MRVRNYLALLILLPIFASADPSPAVKALMNEPASMFDLGLLRLQNRARELAYNIDGPAGWTKPDDFEKYGRLFSAVFYRDGTDEIIIALSVNNPGNVDNDSGRAYCAAVFDYFKTQLSPDALYAFDHVGSRNRSASMALFKRIVVRCKAHTDEGRPWVKGWIAPSADGFESGVISYDGISASGDTSEYEAPLPPLP